MPQRWTQSPKVAVVGGGLAGLAAACALSDSGLRVTLFERRPYLGGRASSYHHPGTGEVVDNCQHVLFGCCTNLIEFYRHIGVNGSPWPVVPGLVVAGAGLALLVVPLVNVVLAAVPAEIAGGASGLFSTAQQLGGALGVALLGTVFFGYLGGGHSFEAALVHAAPYAIGAFALCCILSMLLPRTAVAEEALTAA